MQAICLDKETFSANVSELERQLSTLKLEERDLLRSQLLVEEIFWRMINNGNSEQVKVKVVKKFFGKVQIQLIAEGVSYNPLVEVTDWSDEDEDYYRMLILKANRQQLSWYHKQNCNVVTIDVRGENNRQLWLTVGGMVGGLICGFVIVNVLPPETNALLFENIITPINKMFMNALKMIIAPVIFFSIVSGVINVGAGADVGRIGFKMIILYLVTSIVCALITLPFAQTSFSSDVPRIGDISTTTAINVDSYEFSFIDFIVGIIPSNLVSPIADENILQVIFIAVLSGICLNSLGDSVRPLKELVSNLNTVFMKLVTMIVFFVPLITFLAMTVLMLKMDFAIMLMFVRLMVTQIIIISVVLVLYMLMIRFVGKISPIPFMKKIFSLMTIPFSTSSSAVTMPFTMNFCTKRLGIAEKISSFSIPIGTTINMNGSCIYLPLVSIMFFKMYGVPVDANVMMIILLMTISFAIGSPAVPNASVICILTITSTFGVPNDIAGLLFCVSTICERLVTCLNVVGDVASTLTLSCTENLTDKNIYFNS